MKARREAFMITQKQAGKTNRFRPAFLFKEKAFAVDAKNMLTNFYFSVKLTAVIIKHMSNQIKLLWI